jgi:quercetin dioxygenase-like cupin family protein
MKTMRRGTSILLCLALLLAALPVILPVFTSATAADDQEEQLLGTLSQRFEASGPGVISSGAGDAGGKSYGAYQFSSRSDIPRAFFRWCQSSSDTYYRSIGNRNSEVAYNLLTADTRGSIEFVLMEIPPQTFTADKEHTHTGEETSYVEYGDVDIWLNGEKFRLHAGDAIRIPAGTHHRWFNPGDEMVRVIFAVTPPSF